MEHRACDRAGWVPAEARVGGRLGLTLEVTRLVTLQKDCGSSPVEDV